MVCYSKRTVQQPREQYKFKPTLMNLRGLILIDRNVPSIIQARDLAIPLFLRQVLAFGYFLELEH